MPAADLVGFITSATASENVSPLISTGRPCSKVMVTFGSNLEQFSRQDATPMMGCTMSSTGVEMLEFLASGSPPDIGVGRVGLSTRSPR